MRLRRRPNSHGNSHKIRKNRRRGSTVTVGLLLILTSLVGFAWLRVQNPAKGTSSVTGVAQQPQDFQIRAVGGGSLDEKAARAAEWALSIRNRKTVVDPKPSDDFNEIDGGAAADGAAAHPDRIPSIPTPNLEPPLPPVEAGGSKDSGLPSVSDSDSQYAPPVISGFDILYGRPGFLESVRRRLMPNCHFENEQQGYLPGCAEQDCRRYDSLDEAKTRCLEMGKGCGGVTKQHGQTDAFELRTGTKVISSQAQETSFKRSCSFKVTPRPPEYVVPSGMDIDTIGTVVKGLPTIYVSVASYRDSRCTATIESLFERAKVPERVFVGIVQQNSPGSGDEECIQTPVPCNERPGQTLCRFGRQIRVHMVQAEESLGPTFGRHRADRLYRGEAYAMQVDAHSKMLKNWDDEAISQHLKTGNEYAVLTNYPSDWTALGDDGAAKWHTTPMMCNSHFEGDMVRYDSNPEKPVPARYNGSPLLQPFWGAGASFARGHRIVRVPYDCCLPMMFTGEEFSMTSRMWSNGYDLYTFHHSVIYHQYGGDKRPPMFWENGRSHEHAAEKSRNRLWVIFGFPRPAGTYWDEDIEKYGLGNKRDIRKYRRLFGINLEKRTIAENCPAVTSFKVHDELTKHLRADGKGIDYSQVPDDLFHRSA